MRKIIVLFLVFSQFTVIGQRLNFGLSFNFTSLYYSHFKEDVVFAKHSYRAYYVDKNQFSFGTSLHYNFLANVDFGRYSVSAEFGYFTQSDGLKTKLSYPIANNEFYDFYSKVSYMGYQITPVFNYLLTNKRQLRPYGEVGFPYMLMNESLTGEKIASSRKNGSAYWSNQDEMLTEYGLKHDYFNILLGVGYKMSILSFGIRYIHKINSKSDSETGLGYFTFNICIYTNFSKLKKHNIYID